MQFTNEEEKENNLSFMIKECRVFHFMRNKIIIVPFVIVIIPLLVYACPF